MVQPLYANLNYVLGQGFLSIHATENPGKSREWTETVRGKSRKRFGVNYGNVRGKSRITAL